MRFLDNFMKPEVDTTPEKLDELLSRGVENIYPSKDFLRGRLDKGDRLTLYLGIDPTAPTLHLGHAIALKKLGEFQALGHKVYLLIGDFTGMIGDPTDKSAARQRLSRDEVLKNSAVYKKQSSTFLSFKGKNAAEIKYNSAWLARMSFEDVLDLASHVTVDQMLKRDMFEKRMREEKPIYIHEFLYPLLQGYDSVAMDVDGEIGGNDQTFNMLTGRSLMKGIKGKEKFVMAMKLLTDASGKKMSKTEGNTLSLSDSPVEMYGKVMSWPDEVMLPVFELCTTLSLPELGEVALELKRGVNKKDIKMRLAREIVSIYHGAKNSGLAEENFKKTFEERGVPENSKEILAKRGSDIGELIKNSGLVSSMSEWRRLIDERAVEEIGQAPLSDYKVKADRTMALKIGKRRFAKIIVE